MDRADPAQIERIVATCETCAHWSANSVGRIMGWCAKKGPAPYNPVLRCLGSTAYHDTCGHHLAEQSKQGGGDAS